MIVSIPDLCTLTYFKRITEIQIFEDDEAFIVCQY